MYMYVQCMTDNGCLCYRGSYGVISMCIGTGMGAAAVVQYTA